ncbi:MAG: ABC transporter permease, partial [Pseudomonadota bacterium]
MRQPADFTTHPGADGAATVALAGPLTVGCIGPLDLRLRALAEPVARIDMSGVTAIDTVGAWLAWRTARDWDAEIVGETEEARRLIDAVSVVRGDEPIRPERPEFTERVPEAVGELVTGWGAGSVAITGFLGGILVSMGALIRHPGRIRTKAIVRQLELVGVSALGIIGLMSFLVGIVIAQQGAV